MSDMGQKCLRGQMLQDAPVEESQDTVDSPKNIYVAISLVGYDPLWLKHPQNHATNFRTKHLISPQVKF